MAPMSMPSSREAVATTQRSRPDLSSRSMARRCSLDTEPWWALAMTGALPGRGKAYAVSPISQDSRTRAGSGPLPAADPLPASGAVDPTPARRAQASLRCAVSLSQAPRELTKTSVVR